MDVRDIINNHLDKYDFDIRKSKYARFSDQKCTPDIVSFVADCIMNIIAEKPEFTLYDIWDSQYFIRHTRVLFNKPFGDDTRSQNEYDKVLAQPINLLRYAHILKDVGIQNRRTLLTVDNEKLLDYISRRDSSAYEFLYCYFQKVLSDSGFIKYIEEYREHCWKNVKVAREELYHKFYLLIDGNTPTHSATDITRIFHKIINIFACEYGIPGSKGVDRMAYSDLMYNRTNARDFGKDKSVSRQEAIEYTIAENRLADISNYYVQKAIKTIKQIEERSEVRDAYSSGNATQVHHIFPKHQHPQLAGTLENLILLTPTQHFTKAHPNNNTHIIDVPYQKVCLLSKVDSVEESIRLCGEQYYRKASMVDVVNQGLNIDLSTKVSFTELKEAINYQYRNNIVY